MRYLRILKKKDFDAAIAHDARYQELMEELDTLKEEEELCRGHIVSASGRGKEYASLTEALQKFDIKLKKAHEVYRILLSKRKAFVEELRGKKKVLYDESHEEITEYSRRMLFVQRQIVDQEKQVAKYKNKKYSEIVDGISKQKLAQQRTDNRDPE